jgi:hypothetical protein
MFDSNVINQDSNISSCNNLGLYTSFIDTNNLKKNNFLNAIIDSGANVHVATKLLSTFAKSIGYTVHQSQASCKIGTAKNGSQLIINGWLDLGGRIGKMAVVDDATFNLISVGQLQQANLSVLFDNISTCILDDQKSFHLKIYPESSDKLYYVNVFDLAGPHMQLTTSAAFANIRYQPNHDISNRVWSLHRCMMHISLRRISQMLKNNLLPGANCTAAEVDKVIYIRKKR